MKNILQIVDTYNWAIGRLCEPIRTFNPQFHWKTVEVHPKDLEHGKIDLAPIIEAIKWADIVDVQYWRCLSQLLEKIPELRTKKIVLTHHNEKNLLSYDWKDVATHVAKTKFSQETLREKYPHVSYIPNSYDPDEMKFNDQFPPKPAAIGYVGRITRWKGLKEVARAAFELGYPVKFMGKPDDREYFAEIPQEHIDNIDFEFMDCPDKDRKEFFKTITCYVGNSGSGREVGTLGLIEAMGSGVPVISTPSGLAGDIGEDRENMMLVDYGDYEELKAAIKEVMESPALQGSLRKGGWDTIRGFNNERMAYQYRKVYNDLIYTGRIVSVIIPATEDRAQNVNAILEALEKQTYKNIEAVVVFDEEYAQVSDEIVKALNAFSFPVQVIFTGQGEGYNLAMARNLGAIEASGESLMFCDSRMRPEPDAIEKFLEMAKNSPEKRWMFGNKGFDKSTFVENFSMIPRDEFIRAGMCNERINAYGGMSQELRERFSYQGFKFIYVPEAKAKEMLSSHSSPSKKDDIIRMKNLLYKMRLS